MDLAEQYRPHDYDELTAMARQLKALPFDLYQANRYDTDNQHVVHVWNNKGESFDITLPREGVGG